MLFPVNRAKRLVRSGWEGPKLVLQKQQAADCGLKQPRGQQFQKGLMNYVGEEKRLVQSHLTGRNW